MNGDQISVRRVVLDVLKPLQPNALEFARQVSGAAKGCQVKVRVVEVDSQTESLMVEISGNFVPVDDVITMIRDSGATVHSIDEVEAVNHESTQD
ncbi:hypothetical protein BTA51_05685 [Hahella sp. CCB-MM4]|uniref:DUF211 domain-containing protein n=1 Tax=Hahella sp. (strain CCB-MM4) TaxID=1926491 RepID=UPI000B9B67C4|nr:DUF211 domain-containing protein [Hahella sp. CCB-MM4]OZG74789.1 hypothetical protein BTA51_05685 [Hahella sp. CCB-MM4]